MNGVISRRLKAARERAGINQSVLAEQLGFNDRQTLSAIENGERKISADELLRAAKLLGVQLEYFTDEFRLDGEAHFSWRATDVDSEILKSFEDSASKWVAAYRNIDGLLGVTPNPLEYVLPLTVKSSYEAVQTAAERLCIQWDLGYVPALNLQNAVENHLGALVLYVDAPQGISGAACRIPNYSTIFINRGESEGRRNFDLAHETFHLLTWEQMPPSHKDYWDISHSMGPAKRVEQLAHNFAAALLMPEYSLRVKWDEYNANDVNRWIKQAAEYFKVTVEALKWRVFNLGWLSKELREAIKEHKIAILAKLDSAKSTPRQFGLKFVNRFHDGLANGLLTVRRAAELLGLSIDELAELFKSYELSVPFDL